MPRAAIGLRLAVGLLRERPVHLDAVAGRGRPIHRRPHQRMAKAHAAAHLDQPRRLRRAGGRGTDPQPRQGAPQQRGVAGRLGGRRQQQPLRVTRERTDPPVVALLDAARQRPRIRKPEAACQLCRHEIPRKLEQRERVATRLGDDPLPHLLVEPSLDRRGEQLPGVAVAQPPDRKLRQVRQLRGVARLADGEHDRDRLGEQASRGEAQGLRRLAIQPLRIVDQADERLLLRRLGQ
jgi:hypothetical protein